MCDSSLFFYAPKIFPLATLVLSAKRFSMYCTGNNMTNRCRVVPCILQNLAPCVSSKNQKCCVRSFEGKMKANQCIFWAGWGGSVTPPKFSPEIWAGGGGSVFSAGFEVFPRRGVKSYTFTPYPKNFSPAAPFFFVFFCSAKKKNIQFTMFPGRAEKKIWAKKQTDPPQT